MNSKHLVAAAGVALLALASCKEPGYRMEVETGAEGQTHIREVPYKPGEQPQPYPAAAAPVQTDPQLSQLESLWPTLTPADRSLLIDMAKNQASKH